VGTGKDIAIEGLADIVKKVIGFNGHIKWDRTKPDGTERKLLDVSRLKNMGWYPEMSLVEGIRKAYAFYLNRTL